MKTALHYSHDLLKEVIKPNDIVVDATMGNGKDTLFLARLSRNVHAFDIQEMALTNTSQKLKEARLNANLHLEGHQHVGKYLNNNLKAAIFNLGYLPNSDKSIITIPDNTIRAIEAMMKHLLPTGRIVIVVYSGHLEGIIEKDILLEYVAKIPQEQFQVLNYQFINQRNNPPILLCIEKRRPLK
ncbi:MAG: class I SAM-dependent methyltransferase [Streptococcaceae bacterium]|jgi:16S rRNA C1402 N4-methylase RsmH|nr:class I SAM-dependent methyltransferase [Streptococcaceae bacterium]